MKIALLLITIALNLFAFSQSEATELCQSVYQNAVKNQENGSWSQTGETKLKWLYIDTFTVINRLSAIRGNPHLDSLKIELEFLNDWSEEKIRITKTANANIIAPLSEKFVAAFDSVNWEGVKISKPEFLKYKVLYLPFMRDFTKISDAEINQLDKLVRIPDFLLGKVGVYINTTPKLSYQYIKEIEIDNLYFQQLKYIANVLLNQDKVKLGIAQYE